MWRFMAALEKHLMQKGPHHQKQAGLIYIRMMHFAFCPFIFFSRFSFFVFKQKTLHEVIKEKNKKQISFAVIIIPKKINHSYFCLT
jgi:hypothetical protein